MAQAAGFSWVMSQMTAVPRRRVRSINLGPRSRAVIRFAARFVNPLILLIAGRGWMPVLGVLHHRGRRSGRMHHTPLGMRALGDTFVMPLTFSESAAWYRNVRAAGVCEVTYLGRTQWLAGPRVVDYAAAAPAFPRYERWQFRLIGINEYLVMSKQEGA